MRAALHSRRVWSTAGRAGGLGTWQGEEGVSGSFAHDRKGLASAFKPRRRLWQLPGDGSVTTHAHGSGQKMDHGWHKWTDSPKPPLKISVPKGLGPVLVWLGIMHDKWKRMLGFPAAVGCIFGGPARQHRQCDPALEPGPPCQAPNFPSHPSPYWRRFRQGGGGSHFFSLHQHSDWQHC